MLQKASPPPWETAATRDSGLRRPQITAEAAEGYLLSAGSSWEQAALVRAVRGGVQLAPGHTGRLREVLNVQPLIFSQGTGLSSLRLPNENI